MSYQSILQAFEIKSVEGGNLPVTTPIDGSEIARLHMHDSAEVDAIITRAQDAFLSWRKVPAPRRGELVRLLGEVLRENKEALAKLVTLECGKILEEGRGEVQEMIDICDFAVGLSRQLYGLTIASERPGHAMREYWHPIGPVGVISAFNFPVAVWSWNAALALVCGDPVVWKPSEKTPLTALACLRLFDEACGRFGADAPKDLVQVVIGGREAGEQLADDPRLPVISATGSCRMGRQLAPRVAARFGKTILELGGNNAIIVTDTADLDMAVRATLFGAVGTAGQRCTSTRRLIVHDSIHDELVGRLKQAYDQVTIGDPLDGQHLVGPLIDMASYEAMETSLANIKAQGGDIFGGGRALANQYPNAAYVHPAIAVMPGQSDVVRTETFAPILYVLRYQNFEDALKLHNEVPQGLSSAIFTMNIREAELFTSATGSDCGIANVNIGTSGAEIGGAFGGEKETGGGRESGSDAWKAYMRRMTSTSNYSTQLPLAQGIRFGDDS